MSAALNPLKSEIFPCGRSWQGLMAGFIEKGGLERESDRSKKIEQVLQSDMSIWDRKR